MIFLIFVLALVIFAILCCIKVGADADKNSQIVQELMISKCDKCQEVFTWQLEDAILKGNYNNSYTICCPHCHKLIKISRDRD